MRPFLTHVLLAAAVATAAPLVACSADIHGNTVDVNATVTATTSVDVSNVQPGQMMPIHVDVQNVVLVDPNTTPTADQAATAAYIEFFLDSTSGAPLLVSAQADVNVTIPASTPPGMHKVLCQVYKHDGTPTNTVSEVDFTVKASASASATTTTTGTTTTVDASASATVTTTTTVVDAGSGD
jgi:hypothetical protein